MGYVHRNPCRRFYVFDKHLFCLRQFAKSKLTPDLILDGFTGTLPTVSQMMTRRNIRGDQLPD